MKTFIEKNWFKLVIVIILLIFLFIYYQSIVRDNLAEEQKKFENSLIQDRKDRLEKQVSECITDAYTEVKTLQGNYDSSSIYLCMSNNPMCDTKYWKNASDEAFKKYENEWVPQCKLGNRVFIHYDPITVQDLIESSKK